MDEKYEVKQDVTGGYDLIYKTETPIWELVAMVSRYRDRKIIFFNSLSPDEEHRRREIADIVSGLIKLGYSFIFDTEEI